MLVKTRLLNEDAVIHNNIHKVEYDVNNDEWLLYEKRGREPLRFKAGHLALFESVDWDIRTVERWSEDLLDWADGNGMSDYSEQKLFMHLVKYACQAVNNSDGLLWEKADDAVNKSLIFIQLLSNRIGGIFPIRDYFEAKTKPMNSKEDARLEFTWNLEYLAAALVSDSPHKKDQAGASLTSILHVLDTVAPYPLITYVLEFKE